MDSFKQPAMIVAILALLALVAIAIFFYRKFGSQQEETNKYGERLSGVIKKVGEMPQNTHIEQLVDEINNQKAQLSKQDSIIKDLNEEVTTLHGLVKVMAGHMKEMGYKVKLPHKSHSTTTKGKKSVSFRGRKEELISLSSDSDGNSSENDSNDSGDSDEEEKEEVIIHRSKGKPSKEEDLLDQKIQLARSRRNGGR